MNALADAAFLSRPEAQMNHLVAAQDAHAAVVQSPYTGVAPYSEQEMQAMGLLNGPVPTMPPLHTTMPPPGSMPPPPPPLPGGVRPLVPTAQLPGPGRHLQILDHTVHRIDAHTKANGEEEKEMVVSNLRHFTLKIGVIDPRCGIGRDAELPRAEQIAQHRVSEIGAGLGDIVLRGVELDLGVDDLLRVGVVAEPEVLESQLVDVDLLLREIAVLKKVDQRYQDWLKEIELLDNETNVPKLEGQLKYADEALKEDRDVSATTLPHADVPACRARAPAARA